MFASVIAALRKLRVTARRTHPFVTAGLLVLASGILGTLCILFVVLFFETPGHSPLENSYQDDALRKLTGIRFFYTSAILAPIVETMLAQVLLLEPAKFSLRRYRGYFLRPKYISGLLLVYTVAAMLVFSVSEKLHSFILLTFIASIALSSVFGMLHLLAGSTWSAASRRAFVRLKVGVATAVSVTIFAYGHLAPGIENLPILIGSGIGGGLVFAFGYFIYKDPLRSFGIVWAAHFMGNAIVSAKNLLPETALLVPKEYLYLLIIPVVIYAWLSEQKKKREVEGRV